MSAMSDFLEVEVRKHIFRTGSYTKPTVLRVALCTAATTDAQTGATITEVTNANSYARTGPDPLDANWSGASSTDGLTDNVAAIVFPTSSGSWGTVTHMAIVDSATHGAGNNLVHGALVTSKVVANGDIIQFNIGALDITFA
jgi:hypothetical protein